MADIVVMALESDSSGGEEVVENMICWFFSQIMFYAYIFPQTPTKGKSDLEFWIRTETPENHSYIHKCQNLAVYINFRPWVVHLSIVTRRHTNSCPFELCSLLCHAQHSYYPSTASEDSSSSFYPLHNYCQETNFIPLVAQLVGYVPSASGNR